MDALHGVSKTISRARVPIDHELVHLRASQINGCSVCVDMHGRSLASTAGEPGRQSGVAFVPAGLSTE
jgi:AhpD family alkylhydroperoxidase